MGGSAPSLFLWPSKFLWVFSWANLSLFWSSSRTLTSFAHLDGPLVSVLGPSWSCSNQAIWPDSLSTKKVSMCVLKIYFSFLLQKTLSWSVYKKWYYNVRSHSCNVICLITEESQWSETPRSPRSPLLYIMNLNWGYHKGYETKNVRLNICLYLLILVY